MLLGAGRQKKEDSIDSTAGLLVLKKTGDMVHKGEEIARLFASNRSLFSDAEELYLQALSFSENTPVRSPLILGCIEENELEHY